MMSYVYAKRVFRDSAVTPWPGGRGEGEGETGERKSMERKREVAGEEENGGNLEMRGKGKTKGGRKTGIVEREL